MKEKLIVKVKKKVRDEEGEKNQKTAKESDYVQVSRKRMIWKRWLVI